MTSWLDLDATDPFGLQTLPYGVFSTSDRPTPRVGVRIGGFVLDAAAAAEQAGMESGETWACSSLNRFLGRGPPGLGGSPRVADHGAQRRRLPRRGRAPPPPARRGDHAPALRGRRLRRLLRRRAPCRERRPDLPARQSRPARRVEAPAHRVPRARRHGRRERDRRRPAQRATPCPGRRAPPSFGPSARLDIEAEVGFVVGAAPRTSVCPCRSPRPETTSSGWSCSTTGAPATSRRGSTCRSARSSASRSPRASPRG